MTTSRPPPPAVPPPIYFPTLGPLRHHYSSLRNRSQTCALLEACPVRREPLLTAWRIPEFVTDLARALPSPDAAPIIRCSWSYLSLPLKRKRRSHGVLFLRLSSAPRLDKLHCDVPPPVKTELEAARHTAIRYACDSNFSCPVLSSALNATNSFSPGKFRPLTEVSCSGR